MKEYNGKEVIIMASSICNVKCNHCYISYNGNRTPEELLSIVKCLKDKYNLNINGAENLINLEYLRSYNEINQSFVLTNGMVFLTNEETCKKLKDNNITSVSLSCHFGIQDDLSPIKMKDLNKIINVLKNNDLQFRLMTTITSENYKLVPYMCEQAKKLGAKGIKFTNFIQQGNGKNLDNKIVLNDEQIKIFFELLTEERKKHDINELIIERCGTFGKNYLSINDNFYCDCITDSVVLTPDNNVYPCVFLAQSGNEIGKYEKGCIFIDDDYKNDHGKCIAKEICNEHKKILVRRKIQE